MDQILKRISRRENAQEITLAGTPLGMQLEDFPYVYPDTSRKAFHPLQREDLSQFVAGTVCPSRLGPEKPPGKGLHRRQTFALPVLRGELRKLALSRWVPCARLSPD